MATAPCRAARDGPPEPHRLAVVRVRHVEEDDLPSHRGRLRIQLVEGMDHEHFSLDAVARRADAVPKPEHDHRVASRLDNLRALAAAHPLGHHHALGVHVLEAVLVHLRDRPLNCAIQRGCAAEPVPDAVRQYCQSIPGERAADRLSNQPRGRLAIRIEPARP
jgi:hypothetical protein